jgi:hypothetical protein
MFCEMDFLKKLFCHLRKKATHKYVDEIDTCSEWKLSTESQMAAHIPVKS